MKYIQYAVFGYRLLFFFEIILSKKWSASPLEIHIGQKLSKNGLSMAFQAKLIRHCARVCYLNERYSGSLYPSLADWLLYVNLTSVEVTALLECLRSFPALVSINDKQVCGAFLLDGFWNSFWFHLPEKSTNDIFRLCEWTADELLDFS